MKCIRAEGASPLVELQKLLFLQRGAEIHPEESERARERLRQRKRRGNVEMQWKQKKETEKTENKRRGGGGGGVATRDYLRKKEARKKEGDFVHVSTTQTEEKRK